MRCVYSLRQDSICLAYVVPPATPTPTPNMHTPTQIHKTDRQASRRVVSHACRNTASFLLTARRK